MPDARGKYRTGPNADRIKDLGWLLVQGDARPLAQLLAPQGDEPPFEVGPGPGVLTAELAALARSVVAVEIDERMIAVLRDTLSRLGDGEGSVS